MDEQTSNNGPKDSPKLPEAKVNKNNFVSDLDVRSAEVQEIIGRPPHWLVRVGITGFFGILILVLTAAAVIKYPATLKVAIKLKAINAPKAVESKINGKLVQLNIKNGTYINKGRVLAWIESTAGHAQVLKLSAKIGSMYKWLLNAKFKKLKNIRVAGFTNLGELQGNFQTFVQDYRTFLTYLPDGFYYQKRKILKQEMKYTQLLLEKLKEQKQIQAQKYELAQQAFNRQKKLARRNVISSKEFANQKSRLLESRLPLLNIGSAIINNRAAQVTKKKQIRELNKQIDEQKSIFLQSLNTLKSAIDGWESKYLLIAPISGKLIYSGIIQESQTLQAGREVFFIKPDNARYFGVMKVQQRSFGKIEEGQKVLIRFNGYPAREFGTVEGRISYFSEFPVKDSLFVAKVSFPDGLTTNYGQQIPPTNGMTGKAEIILQDMRLLERFYNNIAEQVR